jgi:hypothetical protein
VRRAAARRDDSRSSFGRRQEHPTKASKGKNFGDWNSVLLCRSGSNIVLQRLRSAAHYV